MKKLSQEEFINRVYKVHGENIKILGKYINRRTKILVKCKCGYEWEANPEPLWNGHGCPRCSNNLKKTTEEFKKELYNLVGNEYEILEDYKSSNKPILFKHNYCGNIFKMSPKSFLYSGQRCPNERYIKSAKSNSIPFKYIQEQVDILGKGDYQIIGNYVKSTEKVDFLHNVCGKIFKMEPTRFIKGGTRCPYCYRSKGEETIREYFEKYEINFKEQYKIKECRNKRVLPFDFAIFENNKLLCLIEYDGSQHFEKKFSSNEKEFAKYNMTIPSQAHKETLRRCND